MKMVELLYGFYYDIYPFRVSASDVGHSGTTRNRLYIIMVHKKHVKKVTDPYLAFFKITKTISQHVRTEPGDYLIATENEILRDAYDTAIIRNKTQKLTATRMQQNIRIMIVSLCFSQW